MAPIYSYGYSHQSSDDRRAEQVQLFIENFDLIITHTRQILRYRDLFFCAPEVAWCSWPYVGGDGPLPLGFLSMGWFEQILTEPCPDCPGQVYLFSFSGSILSGSNSWTGICPSCYGQKSGRNSITTPFSERVSFICDLRRSNPLITKEWEEFDGFEFAWSGNGLKPKRKKRLITRRLTEPVSFEQLISILKEDDFSSLVRLAAPLNSSETGIPLKLKISPRKLENPSDQ